MNYIGNPVLNVKLAERPLLNALLQNKEYYEKYKTYLNDCCVIASEGGDTSDGESFSASNFADIIAGYKDSLTESYTQDSTKFYTVDQFTTAVEELPVLISDRTKAVLKQISGDTEEVTTTVNLSDLGNSIGGNPGGQNPGGQIPGMPDGTPPAMPNGENGKPENTSQPESTDAVTSTATPAPTETPVPTSSQTSAMTDTATTNEEKNNVVKRAVIKKVTKSSQGKCKVQVKKLSSIKGYQIQYATNLNFLKSHKKNFKKNTIKLKNMKEKTYYIRVRAYKSVDGKKIYGKWSRIKTIDFSSKKK